MYLNDLFLTLTAVAEVLPGHPSLTAYPFTGVVLNLNVYTRGHRDGKDLAACLVIPIGTFTGGELALNEPGLVVGLRSGDGILFPSCDITHFNMAYKGRRASLVCHSDRFHSAWVEERFGWSRNTYLDA